MANSYFNNRVMDSNAVINVSNNGIWELPAHDVDKRTVLVNSNYSSSGFVISGEENNDRFSTSCNEFTFCDDDSSESTSTVEEYNYNADANDHTNFQSTTEYLESTTEYLESQNYNESETLESSQNHVSSSETIYSAYQSISFSQSTTLSSIPENCQLPVSPKSQISEYPKSMTFFNENEELKRRVEQLQSVS